MLNVRNQDMIYKVLSCIFAVMLVVFMIVYGNIIDHVYLCLISIFILKYFIEIRKK